MKMLQLTIVCSLIFGNVLLANLPDKEKGIGVTACAYVGGEIGIKSKGCKGLSLSCVTIEYDITLLADNVTPPPPAPPGKIRICVTMKTGNNMQVSFTPEPGEEIRDFVVDKQTTLDPKLSNKMGYTSIKTVPGVYRAVRAADGTVNVDIAVSSK